jgi:hypothetical protein
MAKESRRDGLCIDALDPETRQTCIVQISQHRLLTIAKWGAWAGACRFGKARVPKGHETRFKHTVYHEGND